MIYKLVSKMLENRMKICLVKFVLEEKSIYKKGRSILDNVMIVIEIIHALKRNVKGNNTQLSFKIDIT